MRYALNLLGTITNTPWNVTILACIGLIARVQSCASEESILRELQEPGIKLPLRFDAMSYATKLVALLVHNCRPMLVKN
jgi:hypothetical protein